VWIREVTAHAFGPFEASSIELAEGLTVIIGPNESGKSSWHAAIYAALCGVRHGRGRPMREDEEFAERHKPWDGDEWEVSCVIDLPDGRTVELRHDLSTGVACTARDMNRGIDVTDEIISEGVPDGSHWLGLERRAFRAVASVGQGQILSVTEHAGALQDYLQRAAATAGADETAATALRAIDDYFREHVGLQRANSRKPLMQAIRQHDTANETLDRAVADHADWLQRQHAVSEIEAQAQLARNKALALETVRARRVAENMNERLREATQLAVRNPSPPPDLREDLKLTEQVGTALHDWNLRPDPVPLASPSSRELEERLRLLPNQPSGDLEPAETVRSGQHALTQAVDRHQDHLQEEPKGEAVIDGGAVTESELIDLARELEVPTSRVERDLREDVERLRQNSSEFPGVRRRGAAVLGGSAVVILLIGAILLRAGVTVLGSAGIGVGLLAGIASAVLFGKAASPASNDSTLRAAEARLLVADQLGAEKRERKELAGARSEALGLEPDPASLRRLADEIRRAEHARTTRNEWEERERTLTRCVSEAAEGLARALRDHGVDIDGDATIEELEAAVANYEAECRLRREQAAAARERPDLEHALGVRMRAEEQYANDIERVEQAQLALRDAALAAAVVEERHDIGSLSEDELVARLVSWQQRHDEQREEVETARNEWARLQALLDGGSLGDLESRAGSAQERARTLSGEVDESAVMEVSLGNDPDRAVRESLERAAEMERQATGARREFAVRAEEILSVPEAEERFAAAEEVLARVKSVGEVLETTKSFLTTAQERVHRDIAPVLGAKVRDRLSRITEGRYVEVGVDPETLNVQVRDARGHWRNAEFLSHGTAEQIYLLLRVAMAEILTTEGTRCPLLVDDATVQSDPRRTLAILDVLHEVSREHQVVLLSQEDDVANWAQSSLGPRDRLLSLVVSPL